MSHQELSKPEPERPDRIPSNIIWKPLKLPPMKKIKKDGGKK